MTNTTNYNLNIVQGSDLVNPLIQTNPNFETIDSAMKANADRGVQLATELKSGSVHRITRTNTSAPVFYFVATTDYVAGETFTVDSVQCTAYTTDGQPLTTNAYRIGAKVIGIITGTVITFLVSSGQAAIASDSERLGGELPAYYGTATSVTTAQNTADRAATLAGNAIPKGDVVSIMKVTALPANPTPGVMYCVVEQ